jgi:hypothetical protein
MPADENLRDSVTPGRWDAALLPYNLRHDRATHAAALGKVKSNGHASVFSFQLERYAESCICLNLCLGQLHTQSEVEVTSSVFCSTYARVQHSMVHIQMSSLYNPNLRTLGTTNGGVEVIC